MATNISIKLDVTKIDKAKLFKGDKGTYLDATILMKDEPDQYNNIGMIVQNVSKEERDAGVKGAILGNVKYIQKQAQTNTASNNLMPKINDDLPF
jgi:hypothetical protein